VIQWAIGGDQIVAKKRAFISFDADHDDDLPVMLAGQAKSEDSPFDFSDRSVKEQLSGDWKEKVKRRLGNVDLMIVICGEHTDSASGVSAELNMAKELELPYFLLWGRPKKTCVKPKAASASDKIYEWTWPALKSLIGGAR
jgi:hypothetical protein